MRRTHLRGSVHRHHPAWSPPQLHARLVRQPHQLRQPPRPPSHNSRPAHQLRLTFRPPCGRETTATQRVFRNCCAFSLVTRRFMPSSRPITGPAAHALTHGLRGGKPVAKADSSSAFNASTTTGLPEAVPDRQSTSNRWASPSTVRSPRGSPVTGKCVLPRRRSLSYGFGVTTGEHDCGDREATWPSPW